MIRVTSGFRSKYGSAWPSHRIAARLSRRPPATAYRRSCAGNREIGVRSVSTSVGPRSPDPHPPTSCSCLWRRQPNRFNRGREGAIQFDGPSIKRDYSTVMSAELLHWPSMEIISGYVPGARIGTSRFTWTSPMKPGVRPANCTFAGTPLTVATV